MSDMMSASQRMRERGKQQAAPDLGPAVSQMTAMLSGMRDDLKREVLAEVRGESASEIAVLRQDIASLRSQLNVVGDFRAALAGFTAPSVTVAAPPPAQVTVAAAAPADVTVNPSFTVPPADIKLIPGPKGTKRVTFVRSMNGEIIGATVEEI